MPQPGRPTAGDMTGRKKESDGKQAAQAQAEAAAAMSIATASVTDEEQHGIFDPQTGGLVDSGPENVTAVPAPSAFNAPRASSEAVLSGKESKDQIDAAVASRRTPGEAPVHIVPAAMVTIRVDGDIEDMTYGMINGEPNNFTFKEGLQYRVPYAVAQHLQERGLVRSWNN